MLQICGEKVPEEGQKTNQVAGSCEINEDSGVDTRLGDTEISDSWR